MGNITQLKIVAGQNHFQSTADKPLTF